MNEIALANFYRVLNDADRFPTEKELAEAAIAAKEELNSLRASPVDSTDAGWVPCSERMPGLAKKVLLFSPFLNRVTEGERQPACWVTSNGIYLSDEQVSYWSEMPAAPKK